MKLKGALLAALALSLIGSLGLWWLTPDRLTQAPDITLTTLQGKELSIPIALDIQGEAAKAFGNVSLTPSSFLIAPDGRIIHRQTGELELNKVRSLVVDMLPPLILIAVVLLAVLRPT